jgi:Ca2+-binding RTX toxin-like protein
MLLGGNGADTMSSQDGNNILIAGSTSYDAHTTATQQALCGIGRKWLRTDIIYQAKIDHLSGASAGGLNGAICLKAASPGQTVFNDTSLDGLISGNGSDWFLGNSAGTGVLDTSDRTKTEVAPDLP